MRTFLLTSVLTFGLALAIPMVAAAQSSQTVREAQQALKDKGYDPGPVDGVDGPRTRAAVRDYQKKENLTADGRLGPQTLDSLGVKPAPASTDFKEAGTNLKTSYKTGGKDIGTGGKDLGKDVAHGHPVTGAKTFGKDVGHGVAKIGEGTGHAAANSAKGAKNAVTGDNRKSTKQ